MKNNVVSVIVPVYNAELTICRCIDSILKQSYCNWELILIDDGSMDSSGAICDRYAKEYESIHVIHKENGGVSSARNIGLDNIKGEWVAFIDADDYIEGDFFSAVERCDCDLVIQQTFFFSDDEPLSLFQPVPSVTIRGEEKLQLFFSKYMNYHLFFAPWGKLFRRKVIENLSFPIGQIVGEDTVYNQQAIANISSIEIRNDGKYCYYNVPSHNKYELSVSEALEYLGRVYNAYQSHKYRNESFLAMELVFYTYVCRRDALKNATKWFGSNLVRTVFSECKNEYNTVHRYKMIMSRFPGVYLMYHLLTGKYV